MGTGLRDLDLTRHGNALPGRLPILAGTSFTLPGQFTTLLSTAVHRLPQQSCRPQMSVAANPEPELHCSMMKVGQRKYSRLRGQLFPHQFRFTVELGRVGEQHIIDYPCLARNQLGEDTSLIRLRRESPCLLFVENCWRRLVAGLQLDRPRPASPRQASPTTPTTCRCGGPPSPAPDCATSRYRCPEDAR